MSGLRIFLPIYGREPHTQDGGGQHFMQFPPNDWIDVLNNLPCVALAVIHAMDVI